MSSSLIRRARHKRHSLHRRVARDHARRLDIQHHCLAPGKTLGTGISLPSAAFAVLMGASLLVAFSMLTISAVMFTAVFILLNTGAIWPATWFLRSRSR